jgi:hypothetical protein
MRGQLTTEYLFIFVIAISAAALIVSLVESIYSPVSSPSQLSGFSGFKLQAFYYNGTLLILSFYPPSNIYIINFTGPIKSYSCSSTYDPIYRNNICEIYLSSYHSNANIKLYYNVTNASANLLVSFISVSV